MTLFLNAPERSLSILESSKMKNFPVEEGWLFFFDIVLHIGSVRKCRSHRYYSLNGNLIFSLDKDSLLTRLSTY